MPFADRRNGTMVIASFHAAVARAQRRRESQTITAPNTVIASPLYRFT